MFGLKKQNKTKIIEFINDKLISTFLLHRISMNKMKNKKDTTLSEQFQNPTEKS